MNIGKKAHFFIVVILLTLGIPFYKDVIRTDIAQSVPIPHIRYNEDEQQSMALKPFLTDEIHIDEELYYYIYEPKDTHEERYGFDPK